MNFNLLIFGSVIIVMTLVAVLFISWPWLQKKKIRSGDQKNLNITVYRERIRELETALDYPMLTLEQSEQENRIIMQELLTDIDAVAVVAENNLENKNGRWALFSLIFLLPITALIIYNQIGEGARFFSTEEIHPANREKIPSLDEIVVKLAARLKDNQNDQQGWILLARSYSALENYPQAAEAYSRAYALGGDQDTELLIEYAEVLTLAQNNRITEQAHNLLNAALQKNPDHPQGLWLLGLWAFQEENYQSAIDSWQRLIAILPDNSEFREKIQLAILEAKNRTPKNNPPVPQEK